MRKHMFAAGLLALSFALPAVAQDAPGVGAMEKGDYFFKAGYYVKAAEQYRLEVLKDKTKAEPQMAFANALFAMGNYHYASHSLRRALKRLPPRQQFTPEVASLFPSRLSYMRACDDLKRYVRFNRRDPSALTVLAYTYFAEKEYDKAKTICGYLKLLDREDEVAGFLEPQIKTIKEGGAFDKAPAPEIIKVPPPKPVDPPKPPPVKAKTDIKLPDVKPATELPETKKPLPVPAISE